MTDLMRKQQMFPRLLCQLFNEAFRRGYEISLGEAWRSYETAKLYSQQGKGISNSLHCLRLAIDINLFKDGVLLKTVDEYSELGEVWESYSSEDYSCHWGGRFNDAYHFSIGHGGVK